MKLSNPDLIDLLQKAYSAEKAAAFAYQGHAGSVKDPGEKCAIRQLLCHRLVYAFLFCRKAGERERM
jgi:hypothetical protein